MFYQRKMFFIYDKLLSWELNSASQVVFIACIFYQLTSAFSVVIILKIVNCTLLCFLLLDSQVEQSVSIGLINQAHT